ncbi:hypothetical protein IJJ18_02555 [Candidatus Saccharibacteria bacterium]|nr:hypothetical protein [Candidatus Saccharibacteria bacterium]
MVLDSGNTSYGTYYNWYAATAGTGTYGMSSGTATASICPKGWRLPTNSEFQTLYNNYNSASSMMSSSGPAFVLSGSRGGGSTLDQGSYGYYWSSVAYNNNNAYNLSLYSSNVSPQSSNRKWYGFTVRCIAAS